MPTVAPSVDLLETSGPFVEDEFCAVECVLAYVNTKVVKLTSWSYIPNAGASVENVRKKDQGISLFWVKDV